MTQLEFSPEQRQEKSLPPEKESHHLLLGIMGISEAEESCLAEALAKEFGLTVFNTRLNENPFLSLFYQDPQRYGGLLQKHRLEETFGHLSELVSVMDERATVEVPVRWQFPEIEAPAFHQAGLMKDNEYQDYLQAYEALAEINNVALPDAVIIIRSSFDLLQARIKQLGNTFELWLMKYYPDYFLNKINRLAEWRGKKATRLPILVINTDKNDFPANHHQIFPVCAQLQRQIAFQLKEKEEVILPNSFRPGPIMDSSVAISRMDNPLRRGI